MFLALLFLSNVTLVDCFNITFEDPSFLDRWCGSIFQGVYYITGVVSQLFSVLSSLEWCVNKVKNNLSSIIKDFAEVEEEVSGHVNSCLVIVSPVVVGPSSFFE